LVTVAISPNSATCPSLARLDGNAANPLQGVQVAIHLQQKLAPSLRYCPADTLASLAATCWAKVLAVKPRRDSSAGGNIHPNFFIGFAKQLHLFRTGDGPNLVLQPFR
jgi:hypothetical protein